MFAIQAISDIEYVTLVDASFRRSLLLSFQMLSERDAMARESSVLLASAASDERLMSALLEIETLTKDLAAERQQHNVQVCSHTHTRTHTHACTHNHT